MHVCMYVCINIIYIYMCTYNANYSWMSGLGGGVGGKGKEKHMIKAGLPKGWRTKGKRYSVRSRRQ